MSARVKGVLLATAVAATLSACGTQPSDPAEGSTFGWFSGGAGGSAAESTAESTAGSATESTAVSDGRPELTVPSSVTTSTAFQATGRCPLGGAGPTDASIVAHAVGRPQAGDLTPVDDTGNVYRKLTLSSLDHATDGTVQITLTCVHYSDDGVERSSVTATEVVDYKTTYRPATLVVPTPTVALGGRLPISGRCPYPGATAAAYLTDSTGPALQQTIPVSSDGSFRADVDLGKPVNAPRPDAMPALQPGRGSVSVSCTAGPETSIGAAVPVTITGQAPTPPKPLGATVQAAPNPVRRGGTITVSGTCPKDTWHVAVTVADAAGVFNNYGGPPSGTSFTAQLPVRVGGNQQSTHPASISGDVVTVKASCNRLPGAGGGEILFGATTTVRLR